MCNEVLYAGTHVKCMLDNQLIEKKLFQQHAHCPPNKMKDDVLKFKAFHMHFSLQIEYTTTRKYLANRKEKQFINFLKVNTKLGHNVRKGCLLFDPIYWK